MNKVFNFSAGPSILPTPVLQKMQLELHNWNNLGISIMEISHRSDEFMQLAKNTMYDFRALLNIPEDYEILFCHGGARAQFSAIPMNLLRTSSDVVDYINTGYWSVCAAVEAKKFCDSRIIDALYYKDGVSYVQPMSKWNISSNSIYIHYCPNETIDGISIEEIPCFYKKIIVADFSSIILSRPLNIKKFDIIYAAAQKNIGISGLTVLIIKKDLLKNPYYYSIPSILNYKLLSECHSMFNTPVTISWYIASLIFQWLYQQGGLCKIYKLNKEKAELLYKMIDSNDFYYNTVHPSFRSYMNVPFFLKKKELNNLFLEESRSFGLYGLKGHKIIGGMRASLYNAMPLEGVCQLVKFMKLFSEKYS